MFKKKKESGGFPNLSKANYPPSKSDKIIKLKKNISEKDRLTIDEAAEYLGFSVRTLRRRIADGSIVPIKLGRAYQFYKSDLDSYLRSLRVVKSQASQITSAKKSKRDYSKALRNIGLGSKKKKGK